MDKCHQFLRIEYDYNIKKRGKGTFAEAKDFRTCRNRIISIMKKIVRTLLASLISLPQIFTCAAQKKTIDQKVDSVLQLMTLDEKIGQMNQYNGDWDATGPITKDGDKQNQIRKGKVGSMLNVTGVEHTRELQEIAMESRLKIP